MIDAAPSAKMLMPVAEARLLVGKPLRLGAGGPVVGAVADVNACADEPGFVEILLRIDDARVLENWNSPKPMALVVDEDAPVAPVDVSVKVAP